MMKIIKFTFTIRNTPLRIILFFLPNYEPKLIQRFLYDGSHFKLIIIIISTNKYKAASNT